MAISTAFEISTMTQQKYDQVIKDLNAAGLGSPEGRIYHTASLMGSGMLIFDIWESEELLGKFAEGLIPILVGAGVTPAEPRILQVHNTITP